MGFSDKMCYEVAKDIIDTIFLGKYIHTIEDGKTWYANLNRFLIKESENIQNNKNTQIEFTEKEDLMIATDAMHILLDVLNINEREYEKHEQDVNWDRFYNLIRHYSRCV